MHAATAAAASLMPAPPLRFSIVVPLYDCRDAGLGALESALAQRYPRDRFEVIAVIDAASPPTAGSRVSAWWRAAAITSGG